MTQTPVAFIIFNRPHTTERVFAEIARARPSKLFVIADGPREDHPGDAELCAAAQAITEQVYWECEVFRNYSEVNLGCGRRPVTGIDWVFEHVEEAIILEDDDLPQPSFFKFCDELLVWYRNDERVMMVSGFNLLAGKELESNQIFSYSFVSNPRIWGWATWKRAWQHFDFKIEHWQMLRNTPWLEDKLSYTKLVEPWRRIFDQAYADAGNTNYMIYQWQFAIWAQDGLAIMPHINLISNIGFGQGSTHTQSVTDLREKIPTSDIVFPIRHPDEVVRDVDWEWEADRFHFEEVLPSKQRKPSLRRRLGRKFAYAMLDPVKKPATYLLSRWLHD